jgi:uncharacterized protein (DUF1697 family)
MAQLRKVLTDAGFGDVRTYVQSGNVVLSSDESPEKLARKSERLIAQHLGLEIEVVARTRDELAEVVRFNPLRKVAVNPKLYQVSFLAAEPDADVVDKLAAAKAEPEQFVVDGREIYAWHPGGVGRSRLWATLGGRGLGVTATARNWTTVTKLLAIADE